MPAQFQMLLIFQSPIPNAVDFPKLCASSIFFQNKNTIADGVKNISSKTHAGFIPTILKSTNSLCPGINVSQPSYPLFLNIFHVAIICKIAAIAIQIIHTVIPIPNITPSIVPVPKSDP